jgi:hypothetical protein
VSKPLRLTWRAPDPRFDAHERSEDPRVAAAALFRDARDRWKAKALERQKRLRAAQVRIRDLERSRAYWKERALSAEGRASASGATAAVERRGQRRRGAACGAGADAGCQPSPLPGGDAAEPALYLHAGFGCRGVSWVLRLLAGYLPLGVPASTTVLNWCCRLGLASCGARRRGATIGFSSGSHGGLGRAEVFGGARHSRRGCPRPAIRRVMAT